MSTSKKSDKPISLEEYKRLGDEGVWRELLPGRRVLSPEAKQQLQREIDELEKVRQP